MTDAARAVLAVRDLSVTLHRGNRTTLCLDHVDLTIGRGEIVALVGESGSGKSSLALTIAGLLGSDAGPLIEGSIRIGDTELIGADGETLRRVRRTALGIVFQDPIGSLNPAMRIGRQLLEAIADGTSPATWLERVGIPEPRARLLSYPHQLSGGQCQRVMIAMAMAKRPRLVVADEPTTALDVIVQAQILGLLRRLAREDGTAMLFITHDLGVASALADRVAVLHAGRLVEDGPIGPLIRRPGHPYTAALLGARFGLGVDRSRPLRTLGTDPGPVAAAGSGCAFAPRCLLAVEACTCTRPPMAAVSHGGRAACLRSGEAGSDAGPGSDAAWPARPPAGREVLLELARVDKVFRLPKPTPFARTAALPALVDVDLRVQEGEAIAIVGGSGSGKSTLLRIAAGLLLPDRGDVVLAAGERPQFVFQDATGSFTPWLTIGEQIGERLRPLGLGRAARRERVEAALHEVGLPVTLASALARDLSGGQCQRAALARAVVVPPRLLLCDEPVTGLDMSLAAAVLNLIGSLRRRLGMALLFVTHDLSVARFVADRIIVMAEGRIVEDGPADRIVEAPTHAETRELLAAVPRYAAVA